jgi:hypothetical protein
MKLKNIAWIGGTMVVVITTVSYLAFTRTDKAAILNTNPRPKGSTPDQIVYRQEAKPAIASTKKPLVKYAKVTKPTKLKQRTKAKRSSALPEKPKTIVAAAPVKPDNKLFSLDYLKMQEFTIDTKRDTQLLAAGGMKVSIPAKAFTYKNGKEVEEKVTIQLKEAFTPEDIVLAGLVTKKGEELLESGGMYYINAVCNKEDLAVAKEKTLAIEVPSPTKEKGMELYEGKQTRSGLDWANPMAMNKEEQLLTAASADAAIQFNIKPGLNTISKSKPGKVNTISKDSLGWLQKGEGVLANYYPDYGKFQQDAQLTSYVLSTSRLGWGNIDKLYSDPRSRPVAFDAEVENNGEFDQVSVSMLFRSKRVYLHAYQRTDGSFSFMSGMLPVGEKAVMMVSAYKNGQQYFTLEKVTIGDNMTVKMVPQLMAAEQVKQQINNSL